MYSFSNFEPVHCSVSGSNCCFLNCIWVSQEAGRVICYSHLFKNCPQFVVIHTVKDLSIDNEAEVGFFFWNSFAFSLIQWMILLPFLNPGCTFGSSQFTYCWNLPQSEPTLSITLVACEMMQLCGSLNILWHCPSLGLEWKLTFSSPMATAEFSKFAGILSAAL